MCFQLLNKGNILVKFPCSQMQDFYVSISSSTTQSTKIKINTLLFLLPCLLASFNSV